MSAKSITFAALLGAAAVFAQVSRPEFEVAAIRPYAPQADGDFNLGVHIDGAQVRISGMPLRDLLSVAYRVRANQITGPDWMTDTRFEIAATLPPGTTQGQVGGMLQSLLADRFKIKLHRDKKDFPVYALEVDKGGLKLKPLPAEADSSNGTTVGVAASGAGTGVSVNLGNGSYYSFAGNRLEGKKLTIVALADVLERFSDRPVIDQSGVTGNFDINFDLTEEDFRAMMVRGGLNAGVTLPPQALLALNAGSTASLELALQKVGLKLVSRKAPLDVIVVDEASKTPTEN